MDKIFFGHTIYNETVIMALKLRTVTGKLIAKRCSKVLHIHNIMKGSQERVCNSGTYFSKKSNQSMERKIEKV